MRALFFDFDGTILDTEVAEFESISSIFQEFGIELDTARWTAVIGTAQPSPDFWIDWIEEGAKRTVDRKAVYLEQRRRNLEAVTELHVRDGIIELLKAAQESDVPCAVVSSSSRGWVAPNLDRLGLAEYFSTIVTREDTTKAKPHPDLYWHALGLHGIKRSEAVSVVALEDSFNGSTAAVAAGLTTVTCPNPMTASMNFDHSHLHVSSWADVGFDVLSGLTRQVSPLSDSTRP